MITLRQSAVEWRLVEGEIVALDLRDSMYIAINESGADLWPLLVDGTTRDALIAKLVEEYDIGEDVAAPDVDVFLNMLRERDLVDE